MGSASSAALGPGVSVEPELPELLLVEPELLVPEATLLVESPDAPPVDEPELVVAPPPCPELAVVDPAPL